MLLNGHVFSKELFMETAVTVLFSGAFNPAKPYKTVYLLHGVCGRSSDWTDFTMLPHYANLYNAVFIMPEVSRSFYTDMKYGQKFFTYIAEELPEICVKHFNISSKRENTAVMGASMGGYGALKAALAFPRKYSVCCAFAPGCLFMEDYLKMLREDKAAEDPFREDLRACFGDEFEWSPDIDLLALAQKARGEDLRIFSSCGKDDGLLGINRKFSEKMRNMKLNFTYKELEGGHNWDYFNEALSHGLKFCFENNK